MTARRARYVPQGRLSICDGRIHIGHVELIDGQWRATNVAGKLVGTFTTQKDAVRALPAPGVFDHA